MSTQYPNCFSPITIRGVEFKNRIGVAPNVPGLATENGEVTRELIEYHRAHAKGGAGIVTIGNATANMAAGRDECKMIDLSTNHVIVGLNKYVEAIEQYGAVASIEINHSGRNSIPDYTGPLETVSASPIIGLAEQARAKMEGRRPYPVKDLSTLEVMDLVKWFVDAAVRCQRAGFRMIMLHGGHNNLIGQFCSPWSNKRTDIYGGSFENRARFAIEILKGIREKCGERMVIEYRISADELTPEGLHVEESIRLAQMLEPWVDIFNISIGAVAEIEIVPKMIQPTYYKHMYLADYARQFKEALKTAKVSAVGSVMNLDNAEKILANGWADFVLMMRPFMADPQIVRKTALGKQDDICPCIRCSYHSRILNNKVVGCAVNPMCGHEIEFPKGRVEIADEKKKVLIVGGGPAGMQASITACQRGHDVILCEKTGSLGGNLVFGTTLPMKADLKNYFDYIVRKVNRSGAEIRLNTEVTPELVDEIKPDAIIIAAGASQIVPNLPGIHNKNVHLVCEADGGKVPVGDKIVIVGGGLTGCESAVHFAKLGKDVTVIEMAGPAGVMAGAGAGGIALSGIMKEVGVKVSTNTKLLEVTEKGIKCLNTITTNFCEMDCDTVLLSVGCRPNRDFVESLRHSIPETEIYTVGDVKKIGNVGFAVNAAFWAANAI